MIAHPFFYTKNVATWIQYDGVVHGNPSWWQSIKSILSSDQFRKDRKSALLGMLPPWTGFVVGEHSEEMSPSEALEKFTNTVNCLTQVWIEENGIHRRENVVFHQDEVISFY